MLLGAAQATSFRELFGRCETTTSGSDSMQDVPSAHVSCSCQHLAKRVSALMRAVRASGWPSKGSARAGHMQRMAEDCPGATCEPEARQSDPTNPQQAQHCNHQASHQPLCPGPDTSTQFVSADLLVHAKAEASAPTWLLICRPCVAAVRQRAICSSILALHILQGDTC